MSPNDLDKLTGLFRRDAFDEDFPPALRAAVASGEPLSLILADVDKFKLVNDRHGHLTGDEVLATVGATIRQVVGGRGKCYRYGGEELATLLPNFAADEAAAVAERLRLAIEGSRVSAKQLTVTASFGVAEHPAHAQSTADLFSAADAAVYEAKRLGRNLVRVSGEPKPERPQKTRHTQRRQPIHDEVDPRIPESIRMSYFQRRIAHCPNDDAILNVEEIWVHDRPTPDLSVLCPMCGFRMVIQGPSE